MPQSGFPADQILLSWRDAPVQLQYKLLRGTDRAGRKWDDFAIQFKRLVRGTYHCRLAGPPS
jgi:hypothetical protein